MVLGVQETSMERFMFLACDDESCQSKGECKRYTLFTLGADDVKKGDGTMQRPCKRFLPLSDVKKVSHEKLL